MSINVTLADLMDCGVTEHGHLLFIIEYIKDLDAPRAALAAGYSADYGNELRKRDDISAAVQKALQARLEIAQIDGQWVLDELVNNHYLARQRGELSASNSALNLIAKHGTIDAFAAEKIQVSTDEQIKERLIRGRERMNKKLSFL